MTPSAPTVLTLACLALGMLVPAASAQGPSEYFPPPPLTPDPLAPPSWESAALQRLPSPSETLGPPLESPVESPLAPLQMETETPAEPVYSWYEPAYWIEPDIWGGSFELGVNGNEGNTTAFNIVSGFELKRETDSSVLDLDLDYAKNSSGSDLTAHYALLDARTEWKWDESPWSLFTQKTLRYDEFQNYDLRFTVNSGLGYRFVHTDYYKLKGRFGAGARRDFGGPDPSWIPEAVFGLDYFYRITDRQKLNSQIDYFPAWGDFSDYRLVSDTSWEVLLDEATNLSLKVGVISNYDSTPEGARPSDLYYNILLLWKL